jgi:hypothetical protein
MDGRGGKADTDTVLARTLIPHSCTGARGVCRVCALRELQGQLHVPRPCPSTRTSQFSGSLSRPALAKMPPTL